MNNKTKLAASLIILTMMLPASAAYANGSAIGSGLIRQQQNLSDKATRHQYKAAIASKKDTIKLSNKKDKTLRQTIAQKRKTIKGLTLSIKQSKKQLTSNDLSNLKAQKATINNDITSLKSLNGNIKQDYSTIKTDFKNKDYQAVETQFDNIISIENTRTSDLTNLNSDMDKLISFLQTAASAPTSSSNNTTNSSSSSTQS